MDTTISDKTEEIYNRYWKRMEKKKAGKPWPAQIIMDRTLHSAAATLALIDGIPWGKLTFEMYFLCNDVGFKPFVRLYDSQLELAAINPDKFVFGLHRFYNEVSQKLKKEGKYYEFAQFLGVIMQMQYDKKERLNPNIIYAYISLLQQTLEYLRPNKFDLDVFPYGVSTDGEIIVGPYPLAYSDLPSMEYRSIVERGRNTGSYDDRFRLMQGLYKKYGIVIDTPGDLDILGQTQMAHCNTVAALFPFMNEFTFDIATTTAFPVHREPFGGVTCQAPDIENLVEHLKHRNRTLPSNGVRFEVTDPAGDIKGLLMKELLYNDRIYMLYKLDIFGSSLSGYYDTGTGFLYDVTREAVTEEPYRKVSAFLLSLYASQVVSGIKINDINKWFIRDNGHLEMRAFSKAGKIQDVYHHNSTPRDPELYDREERQINVIIRRLPEGRRASEDAKELAAQYGYELEEGYTFVRPFIRQVFVKKESPSAE